MGGKIGGNEAARRGEGAKKETEEETERERASGTPKKSVEYILVRTILNVIIQRD